jgi:hypothetical protein
VAYTCNGILLSLIKGNPVIWKMMSLSDIMLRETNQSQKNKYHVIPLTASKEVKNIEAGNRMVARRWG